MNFPQLPITSYEDSSQHKLDTYDGIKSIWDLDDLSAQSVKVINYSDSPISHTDTPWFTDCLKFEFFTEQLKCALVHMRTYRASV